MKIGEGRYIKGRNLYMPKAVAEAINIKFGDTIEFHTDGHRIHLEKKELKLG